jgi:hypothetical protein
VWVLIYLLIFLLPIALIVLVFFAIGGAGLTIYRTGKRGYSDLKPYIDDINAKVKVAQNRSASFADRGNNISKTIEEIQGRWEFITEGFSETKKSPAVKLAGLAGKLTSKN